MISPDNIRIERMDLQGVHPIQEINRFKWLAQGAPTSDAAISMIQEDMFDQNNDKKY